MFVYEIAPGHAPHAHDEAFPRGARHGALQWPVLSSGPVSAELRPHTELQLPCLETIELQDASFARNVWSHSILVYVSSHAIKLRFTSLRGHSISGTTSSGKP